MRPTASLAAVLFTFTLYAPAIARADVIFPAPAVCPPGSVGDTHHGGPHCAPDVCTDDPARCATSGAACQEHGLCTEERQGASGGGPFTFKVVVGTCDPEGQCAQGKCEKLKVCMPPAPAAGDPGPAGEGEAPTERKAEEPPVEPAAPAGDTTTHPEEEVEQRGCHLGRTGGGVTGVVALVLLAASGLILRRR